jgi:acyl-CoA reductase-like NAD-dependent aldehyde dehydrogenase
VNYPTHVSHWLDDAEVRSQTRTAGQSATFEKRCPIDDRVLAQVERGGAADVARAIDSASAAADMWARLPAPKRGDVIARAGRLLREREREFGEIVQAETGKPWKNAIAEVASSADLADFMASEGSRFYGKTMTTPVENRAVQTVRTPIGVCAGIMPFNSPLAGIAWKAFPALLCGNALVVKSHEHTPYTAVRFGKLLRDAGLPRGLYGAVQGFGPEVGAPMVRDDRVGVVSFTGSAPTGKLIQRMVSERSVLGKVCLELGGKNPLVVCDDADLALAVEHAAASAFIDAGQRCAAGSRILVFESVYDEFSTRLVERVKAVKVGSGRDDECGPVITRAALERLIQTIDAARNRGSRVLVGGGTVQALAPGYYLQPTVLDAVSHDDDVSQHELFGPITCLYRVRDFDHAVALANSTTFGLTGAIHTRNLHRVQEFVRRYQGGLVSVNGPTYGAGPHMPFGGVKNSGNGFREPGTEALDVYTEWKTVVVNHNPQTI